jgi:hypothetical protein
MQFSLLYRNFERIFSIGKVWTCRVGRLRNFVLRPKFFFVKITKKFVCVAKFRKIFTKFCGVYEILRNFVALYFVTALLHG